MMKKLVVLLGLSLLLTGCFGWEKQAVDDGGVVAPDVVVETNIDDVDTTQSEVSGDEDAKDGDTLGEAQVAEEDSSDETSDDNWVEIPADPAVTAEDKKVEEEVIDEFEWELDDIFKDIGI